MKSIVLKPWGSYQVVEESEKFTIKKIIVKPNGRLSLQSHEHRSEHWVVVQGQAEVTIGSALKNLKVNESVFIPLGAKHRLANNKNEDLVVIEVWYGAKLDENDIIRYEDIYNRK
jgi:mannose-6-phosphate isomerase-like protein (cupin superfamily)